MPNVLTTCGERVTTCPDNGGSAGPCADQETCEGRSRQAAKTTKNTKTLLYRQKNIKKPFNRGINLQKDSIQKYTIPHYIKE